MEDYKEIAAKEFPKYEKLLYWYETRARKKFFYDSGQKIKLPPGYLKGLIYECYVIAWKGFILDKRDGGIDGFKGYLYGHARFFLTFARREFLNWESEAIDARRRKKNKRVVKSFGENEESEIPDNTTPYFDEDAWRYYMEGVSDRTQEIIWLKLVVGMMSKDIGKAYGISGERVRQILLRGYKDIRERITS